MISTPADDEIERLSNILSEKGNTQDTRLAVAAFITSFLEHWCSKTKANYIDALGILEAVKRVVNE